MGSFYPDRVGVNPRPPTAGRVLQSFDAVNTGKVQVPLNSGTFPFLLYDPSITDQAQPAGLRKFSLEYGLSLPRQFPARVCPVLFIVCGERKTCWIIPEIKRHIGLPLPQGRQNRTLIFTRVFGQRFLQ